MSLEEQNSDDPSISLSSLIHPPPVSSSSTTRTSGPYGRWEQVDETSYMSSTVDLQLPDSNTIVKEEEEEEEYIVVQPDEHKQDDLFEEKKPETKQSKVKVEFKKRQVNHQAKRNVRRRDDDSP